MVLSLKPRRQSVIAAASLLLLAGGSHAQQMTCFSLYDVAGQLVFRSNAPPIDMSRQLGEALQGVYPRHHLVFGPETHCAPLGRGALPRSRDHVFSYWHEKTQAEMTAMYPREPERIMAARYREPSGSANHGSARCYVGRRGGTYTLTGAGNKNYERC